MPDNVTQEMIDVAIARIKEAEIRCQKAANKELPRKQHISTFQGHCNHVSRLAQAFEKARQEAVDLKVRFRQQEGK